ncbi:MAG: hypothetical protein JEY96_04190 [Bacteroidales bacterium]|nr:hypothetical protein [Bacteroidales bacterium]
MKNLLKFLSVFLMLGIITVSCSDEFTEEDALEALQKIDLQVAVHDASNGDLAIEGAEVKAVINDQVVTVTSNSNGVAIFKDIKIGGNVNVTVTMADYTSAYTNINTTPDDYRQTVVSGNVYLYATAGDNIATITGQLTIETDLTNRQREFVEGVEVIAYNSSLSYTTTYFSGITDANGNYSIPVAIDGNGGNEVYVYFPTLEKDRTVGKATNNMYTIETKAATYSASNYGETSIVKVPSTFISIAAPPASGTGFQLGLKAVRNMLSSAVDNEFTNEVVITGGSGYDGTQNFIFEADPNGIQAELNVTVNADGVISSINFVDNGARYASMPAIVMSPATGSGAAFDFRFRYVYKLFVDNSGSGYNSFPKVGVEYTSTLDNTSKLRKEFAPDMDASNPLGGGDLFNNAFISSGKILVEDDTQGDTLFTTGYIYSLPVFTYSDEDRLNAEWYASLTAVSLTDGGSLSDNFSSITQGDGYDFSNPPVVTVTALAGYGSGAVVKSEVNVNGQVTDLIVMAKGSGYTQDINDYDGDGVYNEEEDADLIGFSTWSTGYGRHDNVKPGMTYNGDVYYGTGMEKKY